MGPVGPPDTCLPQDDLSHAMDHATMPPRQDLAYIQTLTGSLHELILFFFNKMEPSRLNYQVKIIFILTCLVTFTVHLNIDPLNLSCKTHLME